MSRYAEIRDRLRGTLSGAGERAPESQEPPPDDWDPLAVPYPAAPVLPKAPALYAMDAKRETTLGRKLRMLRPVRDACLACSMCDLGMRDARHDYMVRDPHCFSNMNPTRLVAVGQNPGWNELREGSPFVGEAGANFDRELLRHGLGRELFYICNAVRCYTESNGRPEERHRRRCEPFLAIEMNLLRPKLVVALGAVALEALCPGREFRAALGNITRSGRYGVPVFAVYHPSPRNLDDGGRLQEFRRQMRLLCGLVRALGLD